MNFSEGIYGFFNEYRPLSNYHILKNPVRMFGYDYVTTEAAYQGAKSEDREIRMQFSFIVKPKEARKRGQELVLRPDWSSIKDYVMYEVCRQKFDNNPELKQLLLETEDKYLEETNWWGDNYWGCGSNLKEDCLQGKIHSSGGGLNKLGHCLMTLRQQYQN